MRYTLKRFASKARSVFGDRTDLKISEEGFLTALKVTEAQAMMRVLARYRPYQEQTYFKFLNRQKNIDARVMRDLFEDRRRQFLQDLVNRSIAIVKSENALKRENLNQKMREELETERTLHLSAQPILAMDVYIPGYGGEPRSLYALLYDIYEVVPREKLLCQREGKQEYNCPTLKLLGQKPGLDFIVENLKRQYAQLEVFARGHLNTILEDLKSNKPSSIQKYEQALSRFPGGIKRYERQVEYFSSMSDDQLVEQEVRDRLALSMIERAIEKINRLLRAELSNMDSRDFSHYAKLEGFRLGVLHAFGEKTCGQNPMQPHHDALMARYQRNKVFKQAGDVVFYVAVGASFFIAPPAGVCGAALIASRAALTAAHVYLEVKRAFDEQKLSALRYIAEIDNYEAYALAASQYQSAITLGLIELLIPTYGTKSMSAAAQTIVSLVKKSGAGFRILQSAQKGIYFLFSKSSQGQLRVFRLTQKDMGSLSYLQSLGKTMTRGAVASAKKIISQSSIPTTLAHMTGSALTLSLIEADKYGPDFYKENMYHQNILVTSLADFGLSFFGLGTYSALRRHMAVGGTVFTSSLIAQLLKGVHEPREVAVRGAVDSTFGLTYALWSVNLQNTLRQNMLTKIPKRFFFLRGGTSVLVFTAGSFINNYIYLKTVYGLVASPEKTYETKIWW